MKAPYSNELGHIMVAAKKPINNRERRPKLSIPERTTRRSNAHTAQRAAITGAAAAVEPIHVDAPTGSLSKIAWPSPATFLASIRQMSLKKKIIIAAVIGLGIIGLSIYHHGTATSSTANDPNSVIENLEYQTVLPSGKSIDSLGGWKRVSPSASAPVYAYVDSINGIPVSVSQQPLPDSFKNDTDGQVAELAKKFNATTKLDASGIKVYLGTSAKGPQSVILTKNGLLILIKSQEKVDDSAWIDYAKSLN